MDERVAEHLADEEISIGNYVLSGGELAAAVVVDTVARLLPGVLGNEQSDRVRVVPGRQGTAEGLLDCPHWTRPADFRGWKVPEVLLSGNHEEIRKFRQRAAIEKTARLRPGPAAAGVSGHRSFAGRPVESYMNRRHFLQTAAALPAVRARAASGYRPLVNAYYFRAHMYTMVPRHVREDLRWMADNGNALTLAVLEQDLFAAVENIRIVCEEAAKLG